LEATPSIEIWKAAFATALDETNDLVKSFGQADMCLSQLMKAGPIRNGLVKEAGTCKPGQRADETGCIPANGQAGGPPKNSLQNKAETKTVKVMGQSVEVSINTPKDKLRNWLKNIKKEDLEGYENELPSLRGYVDDNGNLYYWEPFQGGLEIYHQDIFDNMDGDSEDPGIRFRAVLNKDNVVVLETYAGDYASPKVVAAARKLGLTVKRFKVKKSFIEVPNIKQPNPFSCGAAAAMSVGVYFGVGPGRIDEWEHALGTNVKTSTNPNAIIHYLQSLGLRVQAKHEMSIHDLKRATDFGHPVICMIQDYGKRREEGASFPYGHYCIVIGVVDGGDIICQDPSESNITEGEESIQDPGRILVRADTWMKNWYDKDAEGREYVRFGIMVGNGQAVKSFIGRVVKGGEKIVQAAFRVAGKIYPAGPFYLYSVVPWNIWQDNYAGKLEVEQGFLTNTGRFLTRKEAGELVGDATSESILGNGNNILPSKSIKKCMEGPNRGKPGPCPMPGQVGSGATGKPGEYAEDWERPDTRYNPPEPKAVPSHVKTFDDALAKANLTPIEKKRDKQYFTEATKRMPPAALKRLDDNLKGVEFYKSNRELTDEMLRIDPTARQELMPGDVIDGAYQVRDGILKIDGPSAESQENSDVPPYSTYAHELSHAIDGIGGKLSRDREWMDASWSEIVGGELGKYVPPRLTTYAALSPQEAFAEFGRLVFASDKSLNEIEKKFPKCTAFWKKNGIWPEEKPAIHLSGPKNQLPLKSLMGMVSKIHGESGAKPPAGAKPLAGKPCGPGQTHHETGCIPAEKPIGNVKPAAKPEGNDLAEKLANELKDVWETGNAQGMKQGEILSFLQDMKRGSHPALDKLNRAQLVDLAKKIKEKLKPKPPEPKPVEQPAVVAPITEMVGKIVAEIERDKGTGAGLQLVEIYDVILGMRLGLKADQLYGLAKKVQHQLDLNAGDKIRRKPVEPVKPPSEKPVVPKPRPAIDNLVNYLADQIWKDKGVDVREMNTGDFIDYINDKKKAGEGDSAFQSLNDRVIAVLAKKIEEKLKTKPVSSVKPLTPVEEKELETKLASLTAKITDKKPVSGVHVNGAHQVKIDGIKAMWKPGDEEDAGVERGGIQVGTFYKREVAAFNVAKAIGLDDLVPVTVAREIDGKSGSAQLWADNAVDALNVPVGEKYDGEKDRLRAAAFDYLIGNTDRHGRNWMLKDGRFVLIDNGLAFPARNFAGNFRSNIYQKVSGDSAKVPEEVKNWDVTKIEDALVDADVLEEGVMEGVALRLKRLQEHVGSPFGHLPMRDLA
jgi:hypothetical protein